MQSFRANVGIVSSSNNYAITAKQLVYVYCVSAACFDLTVGHHQALQTI